MQLVIVYMDSYFRNLAFHVNRKWKKYIDGYLLIDIKEYMCV